MNKIYKQVWLKFEIWILCLTHYLMLKNCENERISGYLPDITQAVTFFFFWVSQNFAI